MHHHMTPKTHEERMAEVRNRVKKLTDMAHERNSQYLEDQILSITRSLESYLASEVMGVLEGNNYCHGCFGEGTFVNKHGCLNCHDCPQCYGAGTLRFTDGLSRPCRCQDELFNKQVIKPKKNIWNIDKANNKNRQAVLKLFASKGITLP